MPQKNDIDYDFTILDNLTVYARLHGINNSQAEKNAIES